MAKEYEDDFCSEMHDKTKKIHDESDKLINLKILAALTNTKVWCQAIYDFYHVFRKIEIILDTLKDHPRLSCLHFCTQPEFRRTELFQEDLKFYLGEEWEKIVKPSEAVLKYEARLDEIAMNEPILMIAYVHSMYLALLAGGAMLKRIVKKTLGLSDNQGLALFSFGSEAVNKTGLRKRIKESINRIELSKQEKEAIVEEKNRVFQMNNSIANSLPVTLSSFRRVLAFSSSFLIVVVLVAGVLMSRYMDPAIQERE